jgi:chromosome segregation ATPase
MSSYNTEEIINTSLENVHALSQKLNELDELHENLKKSINDSIQIPIQFSKLSKDLHESTENYLSGNNEIFKERIIEIQNQIHQIKDVKSELDTEINRLKEIDLESHFDKHQSKLSEVFNAINGIQNTITSLSQNLIGIVQSIGKIEILIDKNQSKLIAEFSTQNESLADLKKQIMYNESKIKQLSDEIEKHIVGIKVDFLKKIQFFGLIIGGLLVFSILIIIRK